MVGNMGRRDPSVNLSRTRWDFWEMKTETLAIQKFDSDSLTLHVFWIP